MNTNKLPPPSENKSSHTDLKSSSLGTSTNDRIRDEQLDLYRGLIMVFIVCFTHVAFWLKSASEPFTSIILFEMPVIFFISGAALQISNPKRGIIQTIGNRAQRILLPYYIYAIIIVCGVVVAEKFFHLGIIKDSLSTIYNIWYPDSSSIPIPFTNHLWFIVPYLIVCCLFSLERSICDKINRYAFMSILLASCIVAQIWIERGLYRNIIYYNFFMMSGYLFYKKISLTGIIYIASISLAVFITLYNFQWKGAMQIHKFPPDMVFLSFGIFSLSVLSLIFSKIRIPSISIIKHWNKYGYTIYLWQNVSYCIFAVIMLKFFNYDIFNASVLDFIFKSAAIFIISYLISFICIPIEKSISYNVILLYGFIKDRVVNTFYSLTRENR